MWSFPFSLLSQSHRHLWAPMVCNTWWQTLQNICEHHEKNHPQTKKPGHSLTDHTRYLNSDAQTPSPFGAAQVTLHNLRGDRALPLHPPMVTDSRVKQVTTEGKQRDSVCFSTASVHIYKSVSTEDLKYFKRCASSISCVAENDKVTLVQNTLWTNWEKPFLIIYNFNVLQGKEDREILSACTDDDHLSCISCSQRAKDKQALPLPLPTTPVTEAPKLNVDPRLLTTQDYECPNDNCRPLLRAQQQAYSSSM